MARRALLRQCCCSCCLRHLRPGGSWLSLGRHRCVLRAGQRQRLLHQQRLVQWNGHQAGCRLEALGLCPLHQAIMCRLRLLQRGK